MPISKWSLHYLLRKKLCTMVLCVFALPRALYMRVYPTRQDEEFLRNTVDIFVEAVEGWEIYILADVYIWISSCDHLDLNISYRRWPRSREILSKLLAPILLHIGKGLRQEPTLFILSLAGAFRSIVLPVLGRCSRRVGQTSKQQSLPETCLGATILCCSSTL